MSESHDTYAKEYRTDWDKKPFPKSDKSTIEANAEEKYFTGAGKGIEPAEIGARGLDGFDVSPQPYEGDKTADPVSPTEAPAPNVQSNVDAQYFTGAMPNKKLEIGEGDQDGNEKSIG
jgi:hypothetical protein